MGCAYGAIGIRLARSGTIEIRRCIERSSRLCDEAFELQLGSHCGFGEGVDELNFAWRSEVTIENAGKVKQYAGCARWALPGAVSDAVAVLAKIGRRKGNVLHHGVSHRSTSPVQVLYKTIVTDTPDSYQDRTVI
jgi:hypothetical protein